MLVMSWPWCARLLAGRVCGMRYLPRKQVIQSHSHLANREPSPECVLKGIQPPLCEQAPAQETSITQLLQIHAQCSRNIQDVGDSLLEKDNGPSASDLQRELGWFLDDAIEDSCLDKNDGWQRTPWPQIYNMCQQMSHGDKDAARVRLRTNEIAQQWRERLLERKPYQYITRSAHWRDIILAVGPGVLIPRPETEQLVDFVISVLLSRPQLASAAWADLGCGSGALTVGVARALNAYAWPAASPRMHAVDLSSYGVAYTRLNATRLGLASSVLVHQGSWGEPIRHLRLGGLVSNPPYIPAREMQALQAEVGLHEPLLALHGGAGDGMDSLECVIACARELVIPGGFVALETAGGDQAELAAELLRAESGGGDGFVDVVVREDYFGKKRFVTGFKRDSPPEP